MNINASPIPKPSIVFNRTNLTDLYFSPNVTVKPMPSAVKPMPSIIPSVSYKPTPSIILKPSAKVYPSNSLPVYKKNITSITPTIKPSIKPSTTPSSLPIKSFRITNPKYTNIQLGCLAFILFIFYLFINRCNRFVQAKLKKKVDIRVPIKVPDDIHMEDRASARMTPPNSGGKSPRFMMVQKDCEV
jgi:hypothetical protein